MHKPISRDAERAKTRKPIQPRSLEGEKPTPNDKKTLAKN
jgi:hypothetical protein